ncbi:MAG: hypothetical protein UZ12_BCD005002834 [Bacteroidetes bacterium OLB12]|nr:MAG: hypothetical protein UZ12_BCD005002834 [Bacteroidetes bacterium OLB12]
MSEKKKTGFETLAKSGLYPQEALMPVKKSKRSFLLDYPAKFRFRKTGLV